MLPIGDYCKGPHESIWDWNVSSVIDVSRMFVGISTFNHNLSVFNRGGFALGCLRLHHCLTAACAPPALNFALTLTHSLSLYLSLSLHLSISLSLHLSISLSLHLSISLSRSRSRSLSLPHWLKASCSSPLDCGLNAAAAGLARRVRVRIRGSGVWENKGY